MLKKRNFCRYAAAVQSETYFYRKEMADQVTGRLNLLLPREGFLVVDKAAVIYGGTDITKDVSDSLAKSTSVSADAAKTDAAKTDSSTTK